MRSITARLVLMSILCAPIAHSQDEVTKYTPIPADTVYSRLSGIWVNNAGKELAFLNKKLFISTNNGDVTKMFNLRIVRSSKIVTSDGMFSFLVDFKVESSAGESSILSIIATTISASGMLPRIETLGVSMPDGTMLNFKKKY